MNERDEEIPEREDWVPVGHYDSLQQAYDHGLVVLAMGETCRVEPAAALGSFDLQAEAGHAVKISKELDAYGKELAEAKARILPEYEPSRYPAGWAFAGLWIFTLLVSFIWKARDPALVDIAASSSVGLFGQHEWWRPFTALFLHADVPHLAGNILGGTIFGVLVAKAMGPVKGWLAILASGTLGNILTAWLNYPGAFLSIGASTAVFGALGILSGLGVAETFRLRLHLPVSRVIAPVVAGVVVLSWLGSGNGEGNTDVLGHVMGFASGVAAGGVAGYQAHKRA